MLDGSANMTCTVLFSQFDQMRVIPMSLVYAPLQSSAVTKSQQGRITFFFFLAFKKDIIVSLHHDGA